MTCYLFVSMAAIFAGYMYANYMFTVGPRIIASVSVIYLVSIFIYKLINVYQKSDITCSDDKYLVNVITKVSLLTFISTSNVIISVTCSGLRPVFNYSVHWDLFVTVIMNLDMFSNFLCVYLAEKYFKSWYNKLCGCGHVRCTKCWNFCLGNDMDIKNMITSIREGSKSRTTGTRATTNRTSVMSGVSIVSADIVSSDKKDVNDELPPNNPGFTTLRTLSSFSTEDTDAYTSDTEGHNTSTLKLDVTAGDKSDPNITAPPSRRHSLSTIVGSPNMDDVVVIDGAEIEYNNCPDPMMVFTKAAEREMEAHSELDHGDYQKEKQLNLSNIESGIDATGIAACLENKLSVLESANV